ncbi:MAG: hypothetical protein WC862_02695 [Patescibacteria group bacterium]
MNDEFKQKHQTELDRPVTMGILLEYTDEFLIPRFSELMDDKIKEANAKQTHEIKSYLDNRLADHTAELFSRLDRKYQSEKQFREKVVELFRKHQIGTTEDIAYLAGLAAGI